MNSTITDAELNANSLLRLGTAPAYTCGKCGGSVGRGEPHDCPAMTAAREGTLKPNVIETPRMADAPPNETVAAELTELKRRVAALETQLAATPLPESDGEPTVLVERAKRKR